MLTGVSRRPGGMMAGLLIALLAGCSMIAPTRPSTGLQTVPDPPPTTARPAPSPAPSSSARPTDPGQTLRGNAVYAVDLATRVRCRLEIRSPRPPLADHRLAGHLRKAVECLMEVWAAPLAAAGITLQEPRIRTYRRSVKTLCGTFRSGRAPAYYCSASSTIYWPLSGDDGNEAYTFARIGYLALLAHEFGHHLQSATGILPAYAERIDETERTADRHRLSRRLELQAQCFEGAFLRAVRRDIDFSARDHDQLEVWHSYTGDEDPPASRGPDHGTSAAQVRWLDRGLATHDLGRCNTWTASPGSVR